MTKKSSCSIVTKEEKEKFDQMFLIAKGLRDHTVMHYTELDNKLKSWIDTVEGIFEKYYNNGDSRLTYRQLWIVNNMVSMIYATSKTTSVEEMFPMLTMGCKLMYCNCEGEADFRTFRELLHDLFQEWYYICNGYGERKAAEKYIMNWEERAESLKLSEINQQIALRLFHFLCSDEVKRMARNISAKEAEKCEMKIDFDGITPSLSHDEVLFRKCYLWFLTQDIMSIDDDGNVAFDHLEKIPKMVSESEDPDILLKKYLEMEIWVSLLQKAKEKISVTKRKEERNVVVLDMPMELQSPEAMHLFDIAKDKKWIDESLQPIISQKKAAILASVISDELKLEPRWPALEKLWKMEDLSTKLSKAQGNKYYSEFLKEIEMSLINK